LDWIGLWFRVGSAAALSSASTFQQWILQLPLGRFVFIASMFEV